MDNKNLKPESLMMSYGYRPEWSEGAIKCPIFQTSTFVFESAEAGKAFFELTYGLRQKEENEQIGLIYSRLNNPDLEILENRLTLWDGAEDCAVFESGMAAISTCLLEFLKPNDVLLFSNSLYGGTDHFIKHILVKWGVEVVGFSPAQSADEVAAMLVEKGIAERVAMIYLETPANPTNRLVDIEAFSNLAKRLSSPEKRVYTAVDNTYMGPIWQHPLQHGADFVLYSATKYIGGHSDVIAGACLGSKPLMRRIRALRTLLGNMAAPWTGWMLMRSLETMKVRMDMQAWNCRRVADYLAQHPKVSKVYYLGHLSETTDSEQFEIYKRQCTAAGAMLSFEIKGHEREAFLFMNHLKLIHLAVSLGSTESLVQHPATMTHAGVDPQHRLSVGITDSLIRLSIGVEHFEDLIADISNALEHI